MTSNLNETRIPRRTFLRGATGAMALPWLNLMEKTAIADKISPTNKPPLRFMALYKPNGVYPPSWEIGGGTETEFDLAPLMKSLEPYRKDLLVLSNMGNKGSSTHQAAAVRFLSAAPDYSYKTTSSKELLTTPKSTMASIDQRIAQHIGQSSPIRSLELTAEPRDQGYCSYISFDEKHRPLPRSRNPKEIFDRVFKNPFNSPVYRKKMISLLDDVQDDAKALLRKAGKEDRRILDEYFSVVRETEKRIGNLKSTGKSSEVTTIEQRLKNGKNTLSEEIEIMLDISALALWTDNTRCISYMLGSTNSRIVYDFLGTREHHHTLSHFLRKFSSKNVGDLHKIIDWQVQKFAYLLKRMGSYRDGHGTLLDNSIVLFGGAMGHSDSHTANRIPTIIAGNGQGSIKTNRHIHYAKGQPLSRLHLSLLQTFGLNTKAIGDEKTPLAGLDGSKYVAHVKKPFKKWIKVSGRSITVQGRLRMSEKFDDATSFYIDLDDGTAVKISVSFNVMKRQELPYRCGEFLILTGTGSKVNGQYVMTSIKSLKQL